jgi:hypothetical protein
MIVPDPSKLGRPLLLLGLAAAGTAVALWARRRLKTERPIKPGPGKLIRVEPAEPCPLTVEVPWGTEVPR